MGQIMSRECDTFCATSSYVINHHKVTQVVSLTSEVYKCTFNVYILDVFICMYCIYIHVSNYVYVFFSCKHLHCFFMKLDWFFFFKWVIKVKIWTWACVYKYEKLSRKYENFKYHYQVIWWVFLHMCVCVCRYVYMHVSLCTVYV